MVLMTTVFRRVFPVVNEELTYWHKKAEQIPNKELRKQALASIEAKRFHCQGGAVFALLAEEYWKDAIRFIVAYQTISDYLDNLCDRSTSLDPDDFRLLHQAMEDALSLENDGTNYYGHRDEQDDGGYLTELVHTCQNVLQGIPYFSFVKKQLLKLENMYANLQVHKHVKEDERLDRLMRWYEENKEKTPTLSWYEFAAATGSTLGVFCLISYALSGKITEELAQIIYENYFPYMQGLHILLDYYIDQQEDKIKGDLNFCSFYSNQDQLKERLLYFIKETDKAVQRLPDKKFHQFVHHGLVGLYLGDEKVMGLDGGAKMVKELLRISGRTAKFFHWNVKMYYRFEKDRETS
ncbi:tetraprenyl-beta-curcumene synthase family protein [Oceanobacillus bengalensis]|uniref:Tetraprenyl-beta-curcumene synthase family protein n=2 Tax=Oceanobacillus bengalensis TaxID=1435466 RepID=A0A494YX08_9BACI|nr:tetraprenyl-beta-curcumene synthase family protein [Oceanobacillus bengalensis]RKQ14553.1 tetraprenyl-beta-curcumene synthase family protein [Oceanobacillus bengalensis]